jgi:phage/plasmid-like protein (TIGR03299 family)
MLQTLSESRASRLHLSGRVTSRTRHTRVDVRGAESADELLARAGSDFGFRVEARPAYFHTDLDVGEDAFREAPAQVIVRADTQEALSVVGPTYVPAQVRDFLAPLDPLIRERQLVPVSVANFDRGLSQVVELQLPRPIVLPGPNGTEDVLFLRVLYRNSHDGSSRLAFLDSLLRQWCKNGATHVIGMMGAFFKHTAAKMAEAVDLAPAVLDAHERFRLVEANAQRLLATPFSRGDMATVAERLYPAREEGEVSPRAEKARDAIVELFDNGQATFGRTAWDAFNAVTEWSTHHRPVRSNQPQLARLRAVWNGDAQLDAALRAIADVTGMTVTKEGALA